MDDFNNEKRKKKRLKKKKMNQNPGFLSDLSRTLLLFLCQGSAPQAQPRARHTLKSYSQHLKSLSVFKSILDHIHIDIDIDQG